MIKSAQIEKTENVEMATEELKDESETVAAIIAAIAAYEGKAPENFRVVSFKKRF